MPIIVNVDVMLAKRKMFSTLEKICEVLECKPGDILDYKKGE